VEFSVEFVELENDKKPLAVFVVDLSIEDRAKVSETFNFFLELKKRNLPIKENLSTHLDEGNYDLRISLSHKIARILSYYQKGANIIITHGFIKKSQKTPAKEIARAKKYREIYSRRKYND